VRSSQHNPQLAKRHVSYSVDEIARLFEVHRNTVRAWIKAGLQTIDSRRPQLVHGADLASYLRNKRKARKQRCAPGEMFCMRCRVPRRPVDDRATFQPLTASQGNLAGRCNACASRMFRRVSIAKLASATGDLALTMTQGGEHIAESQIHTVNRNFAQEG
jgi:hypothetical protein